MTISRSDFEKGCQSRAWYAYLGDSTGLCRVFGDRSLFVETRDLELTPHLIRDGYWESWITLAIRKALRPGMHCLDVGANCGYYSVLMADAVGESGRVLAVEPNPRLVDLLQRTLRLNGFTGFSEVCERAASSKGGEPVEFQIVDGIFWGGVSQLRGDNPGGHPTFPAQTVTIDELTATWPRVDLIKIDVEGAEIAVWEGMQETICRSHRLQIFMEFSGCRYAEGEAFLKSIREAGFNIFEVDSRSNSVPKDDKSLLAMEHSWVMLHLLR